MGDDIGFATGAAVNFVLGTALFGVALLLPLYFEILRARSPLQTGLLLAPQGLGAAVTISLAGYLTDKADARRVIPGGVLLALAGTGWFTQIGAHTPYWALLAALFLVGAGLGATITRSWPLPSSSCRSPRWCKPRAPSTWFSGWQARSVLRCWPWCSSRRSPSG